MTGREETQMGAKLDYNLYELLAVNIARTIRAASSSARNFFICVSPFHFYYVIPFCQ